MKSPRGERNFKISKLLVIAAVLTVFAFVNVSGINAQKGKKIGKSVKKKTPSIRVEKIKSLSDICVPIEKTYQSIIQIDKDSKITVTVQINSDTKTIAVDQPMSSLPKLLSAIDKKSVVTVKSDPTLGFELIADTLQQARRILDNCINIEASTITENPYIYIFPEPRPDDVILKPNPNTLVVKLDKDSNITLNTDKQGSLNDTSPLTNTLKEIFNDRDKYGVLREGTNIVETTVIVKPDNSSKFGDIIKIVDAVKQAGASPVGLQIDDMKSSLEMPTPPIILKKP